MAMTGAGLKAAIIAKLSDPSVDQPIYDDKYIQAFAEAVIEYIQTNAELAGAVTTPNTTTGTITTLGSSVL